LVSELVESIPALPAMRFLQKSLVAAIAIATIAAACSLSDAAEMVTTASAGMTTPPESTDLTLDINYSLTDADMSVPCSRCRLTR
jgi:hypothetical protein